MKRLLQYESYLKIGLLIAGMLIAIILTEISMYILFSVREGYYIWPPSLVQYFHPNPDTMPGVEGVARFLVNSQGIRGDEISPGYNYRILALGGSTTEAAYLDQLESWPYLLQKKLNEGSSSYVVWVGNAGRSGAYTRHHVIQLKYLLEQFPDLNAIIMLIGVNDLCWRLGEDFDYSPYFLEEPDSEEELLPLAFAVFPLSRKGALPYYKRTAIWNLGKKVKYFALSMGFVQDKGGRIYERWRKQRREAIAIRDYLPDLTTALEEYSRNINTIIDLANARSIRLIFMTQPVLWKSDMSEDLKNLLFMGGIINSQKKIRKEYYSVEALVTGVEMFNKTLLDTCKARQVEYFDLASLIPKDTTAFYDDCHFNERGNEMVAQFLSQYILQHKPLRPEE